MINREVMQFLVKEKEIFYTDKKWRNWVRCIPKDTKLVEIVRMSRNRVPRELLRLFELTQREKEEYESAKTEEELANIIKKDASQKGCRFIKMEKVKNES
jgi:hypothetical protein